MLRVRNNAVISTPLSVTITDTIVPFDTTDLATNDNCRLVNNTIEFTRLGYYNTELTIVLENSGSSSTDVEIVPVLNGVDKDTAFIRATIPAGATVTLSLPWIVNVIEAESGMANVSWELIGSGFTINNAYAEVYRYS